MRRLIPGLLLLLGLSGCSSQAQMTVFAAASLGEVFPAIADQAGTDASFWFDGSSGLVDQLEGGARADLLATADGATMERAVDLGLTDGEPLQFARNELALAVEEGNPLGIRSLEDIEGLKLVVCAPDVPCGRATRALADDMGLHLTPVSEELNVTDTVGKVASGEADVGVVYSTSIVDGVDLLPIPEAADQGTSLWITALAEAPHPDAARAFIGAVRSADGQALLARAGFKAVP